MWSLDGIKIFVFNLQNLSIEVAMFLVAAMLEVGHMALKEIGKHSSSTF